MKKEMLINVLQPEETRIAILEDGILEELYLERESNEGFVGNIYKGKIVNIEPSIQAAFVDFGVGRNGFLHISDVDPFYFEGGSGIDALLKSCEPGTKPSGGRSSRDLDPEDVVIDVESTSDDDDSADDDSVDDAGPPDAESSSSTDEQSRPKRRRRRRRRGGRGPNKDADASEQQDSSEKSEAQEESPLPDLEDFEIDVEEVVDESPQDEEETSRDESSEEEVVVTARVEPEEVPAPHDEEEGEDEDDEDDDSFGLGIFEEGAAANRDVDDDSDDDSDEDDDENLSFGGEASASGEDDPEDGDPPIETQPGVPRRTEDDDDDDGGFGEGLFDDLDLSEPERGEKEEASDVVIETSDDDVDADEDEDGDSSEDDDSDAGTKPESVADSSDDDSESVADSSDDDSESDDDSGSDEEGEQEESGVAAEASSEDGAPKRRRRRRRGGRRRKPKSDENSDEQAASAEQSNGTSDAADSNPADDEDDSQDFQIEEDSVDDDDDDDFVPSGPRSRSGNRRGRSNGRSNGRPRGNPRRPRERPPIQDIFRRGQEVLVQVIKEGLGNKGPTLSTYVSIPGRYLVLMPGLNRVGVSRKIADDEQRRQLRDMVQGIERPENVGFIVRTAGVERTKRELERDMSYLVRLWEVVVKRIKSQRSPAVIYQESDMIIRTIRDIFSSDINTIWIDEPSAYERAREFLQQVMPRYVNRLKLYEKPEPLFHHFKIEEEISRIQERTVPLPQGGSIVIDQSEALVAIDVNSGNFRADDNAEETAYQMNLAAAKEIARQLRLRDLGGVIVNDFIDMREDRHRRSVEQALRDAVKRDRARTKILRMSAFGLVEMTRQRIRPSLKRSLYRECPMCRGSGQIKTVESMAIDCIRMLTFVGQRGRVHRMELVVDPDIATYLQNNKRHELVEIEQNWKVALTIVGREMKSPEEVELSCFDGNDNPTDTNGRPLRRDRR
ncbi:Ribonuclease E [Planctomycetes bacterium Pan216]|uniref:Ribonuclease G n=1 Tax=Kolteria novifilia TaxID=2527975 RepID=A0A518B9J5_9BACT|nr:Ribonuclease E [Planctomycetes bacterium Pan216]